MKWTLLPSSPRSRAYSMASPATDGTSPWSEPGPLDAHEEQVHGPALRGQPLDGPDRGERVQPAPQPASPQQHLVVGADPGPHALEHLLPVHGRRRSGRPKGTTSRNDAVGAVVAVGVQVDQAREPDAAEPQVALLLAGADDEVGHRALGGDGAGQAPGQAVLARRAGVGQRLQQFDDQGVVEVGHVADGQLLHVAQQLGGQLLGDHHVVAAQRLEQRLEVLGRGLHQLDPLLLERAGRGRRQRDPAGERASTRASSSARMAGPAMEPPTGLAAHDEHPRHAAPPTQPWPSRRE